MNKTLDKILDYAALAALLVGSYYALKHESRQWEERELRNKYTVRVLEKKDASGQPTIMGVEVYHNSNPKNKTVYVPGAFSSRMSTLPPGTRAIDVVVGEAESQMQSNSYVAKK